MCRTGLPKAPRSKRRSIGAAASLDAELASPVGSERKSAGAFLPGILRLMAAGCDMPKRLLISNAVEPTVADALRP